MREDDIKYIFVSASSNFGNMISMALASLYLPFLPMLAKQILLNNLLADIPSMGIAGDNVDRQWQHTPHRWDIGLIRRAMLTFGLTSTAFDLLTFVVLLALSHGDPRAFRTGWFIESLLTQLAILLVIRTYRPFYRSRPGRFLRWSVPAVMLVALALPYSPLAEAFEFHRLSATSLAAVLAIVAAYVAVSEASKRVFYRFGGIARTRRHARMAG